MSAVDVDEILEHQLNANMLLMPYEVYAQLFDSVAELGDENAKLRELCADLYAEMITYSNAPNYNASVWAPKLRELGVEVDA